MREPLDRADLGGGPGRTLAVHVGDHDAVAAGDHPLGDAAADPAGTSGDDAAGGDGTAAVLDMAGVKQTVVSTGEASRADSPPTRTSGAYVADVTPVADPRIAAVEGNLAAFHSVLMTLPSMAVEQQPDVTAFRSGFAHPLFNGVVGARFAPGTERSGQRRRWHRSSSGSCRSCGGPRRRPGPRPLQVR